jgi:uncharacterized protein YggE
MRALPVTLVLLTLSIPLRAQQESPRTISVTGEAVVMVVPNQAVVTIGVETFDTKLDVATQTNDRIAKALLAEWKRLGVADSRIQSEGTSVDILYDTRDSSRRRVVEGFVVRRSYEVTAGDAAMADRVIALGIANGANQLGGISFRTTELRKYRDQARVSAVRAAREKAELIASQLGAKVGPPRTISEGSSYYGWGGSRGAMTQNAMTEVSGDGGETEGSVAPGMISVRASIAVVFDLR